MQINVETNMKPVKHSEYGDNYLRNELRNVVRILRRACKNPKVTVSPLSKYGEIKLFIEGVNYKSLRNIWYADALYDLMAESSDGMCLLLCPDANVCGQPYIKVTEEDFDTNTLTSRCYTMDKKEDGTYEMIETLEQTEYGVVVQNG